MLRLFVWHQLCVPVASYPKFRTQSSKNMCSRVWFITDRRISQEYPQVQILRALKERCVEDDVEFRYLLMDEIVLTITDGQLGKNRTHIYTYIPSVRALKLFLCLNC